MEHQDIQSPKDSNPLFESNLFSGRQMVVATMHGKQQAFDPLISQGLGVSLVVPEDFNSDQYGTFSGEIARDLTPYQAALQKCKAALALTGLDLALASEGSFGPHPVLGFVPADEEWLVLLDQRFDLVIAAHLLSTNTNFNAALFHDAAQALAFAEQALFPSHALIIKSDKDDYRDMVKGVNDTKQLQDALAYFLSKYGKVYLETDMRAMNNPSRMAVIQQAAAQLLDHVRHTCTRCNAPGFVITERRHGLPCALCGAPTRGILANVRACAKCRFEQDEPFPDGKTHEDPMYCMNCNP